MAAHGKIPSKDEKKKLKRELELLRGRVVRYSAMENHPSCSPMDKACYRAKRRAAQAALRIAMRASKLL